MSDSRDEGDTSVLTFRWPVVPGAVVTQEALDSQIGRQVYVGGPAPARRGTVVTATVTDDSTAIKVAVKLLDERPYTGPLTG